MSNKLKENTRIKSTIILLTTIVLITFISIIVIKLNTYINRNPYLDEINEIIQQKYGEDFWIDNNCTKDDKISEITIYACEKTYQSDNIFEKTNIIQKIIYKYINNNKKNFDKINQIVEEQGGIKKTKQEGVSLFFRNNDRTQSSGRLNVFCFFNDIKYKTTTGFNSLIICAKSSDAEYSNITFIKIIYFDKIKYLKYSGTNIDDIFILEKMQNLEELSLEISDNDTFYKAKSIAKKMGISIHIT